MPTKVTESTEEEVRDHYIKFLEGLVDKAKSGEMVFRSINQAMPYVQVYDNETEKWEHFRIGSRTLGWIYECPAQDELERARLKQFLVDHPKAEVIKEKSAEDTARELRALVEGSKRNGLE